MVEMDPRVTSIVSTSLPHNGARGHVTGAARYIDDLPLPPQLLHLAFGLSTQAHARIQIVDLEAVRNMPGVVAVFTASDIPGENNVAPIMRDDPLLAEDVVTFVGQPIFLVAAETREAARRAARRGHIEYDPLPASLTIAEARAADSKIEPAQTMLRGEPDATLAAAAHRLSGSIEFGGQEHFYLEGQVAQALPGEDGQVFVNSSTQHPSEIQHLIAHLLHRNSADITVEVRRMGGGFGGKETQATGPAAARALVAALTGILCFLRHLDEDAALETFRAAEPWFGRIAGVGLDSSEVGHPPSKFARVFAAASDAGLKRVAHAGEEGPPAYVHEALDLLHIDRLDHGNRALEDARLTTRLAREAMTLTVCPLSNHKLCVVKDMADHPIDRMLAQGLRATINSDDPAYFGGYIGDNYRAVTASRKLSRKDLATLARNSFLGSFLNDDEISTQLTLLDTYLATNG